MKYIGEFKKYFAGEKSFTFKDAAMLLRHFGASDAYAKLFIHKMLVNKAIMRIGKGVYTFSKDEAVVGFAFTPFYYGLEHALTIRGLWTQVSGPVVITSTGAKAGIRQAMGVRIMVRRISKKAFFGYEYIRHSSIIVPVSDLEKTLVDFVYYGIGIDNGEIKRLVFKADWKKLIKYSKRAGINPRVFEKALTASSRDLRAATRCSSDLR